MEARQLLLLLGFLVALENFQMSHKGFSAQGFHMNIKLTHDSTASPL